MEKLFGRTYETIGSTGSDFIIKTKGQVKIQWGGKFIDIVKDGKLVSDTDLFHVVSTENEIASIDGIYYVLEDGSIYVVIGGNKVNIVGEVGTVYVSFQAPQSTTANQKTQAQENIGLIFDSLKELESSNLTDGIASIKGDSVIYKIANKKITPYIPEIEQPWTKQFIIKKESGGEGALVIQGNDKSNSIKFNQSAYIYYTIDGFRIESDIPVIINNNFEIRNNSAIIRNSATFNNGWKSNLFSSSDGSAYSMKVLNGESYLKVDHIDWTCMPEFNSISPSSWANTSTRISSATLLTESSDTDNYNHYLIDLNTSIEVQTGDVLCTYIYEIITSEDEEIQSTQFTKVQLIVEDASNPMSIQVKTGDYDISANLEDVLQYKMVYLINRVPITRTSKNNIDLLHVNSVAEEEDINNIKTRIGSIQDLNFTREGHNIGTLAEGNIGIYSDNLITVGAKQIKSDLYAPTFKASPNGEFPKYDSGFNIPVDDDSKTVVTSEWVNDKTDKRLEEYVRKDQLISLIESYIQPVDGTRSNPVTLVAGTIRRATNSTTDWYFIGGKKARITDVQVTVKDGLMTITLVPASGSTINVLAVSAVIGDTGEFNGDFSITSRGGRGAGAHWCNAIPDPNTSGVIRVREYHQANDNNDSWGTANWNYSNGPISLSFAAFGYIVG